MSQGVSLVSVDIDSEAVVEHVIASLIRFVGPESQKVDPEEVKAATALLEAVAMREALKDAEDDPLDDLYNDAGNRDGEDDDNNGDAEPELDN